MIQRILNLFKRSEVKGAVSLEKQLFKLIHKLQEQEENPVLLDRKIQQIIFNAKYYEKFKGPNREERPTQKIEEFFIKANKGDTTFLSDPFYIYLKANQDKIIKKLKYRIKRNRDGRGVTIPRG